MQQQKYLSRFQYLLAVNRNGAQAQTYSWPILTKIYDNKCAFCPPIKKWWVKLVCIISRYILPCVSFFTETFIVFVFDLLDKFWQLVLKFIDKNSWLRIHLSVVKKTMLIPKQGYMFTYGLHINHQKCWLDRQPSPGRRCYAIWLWKLS